MAFFRKNWVEYYLSLLAVLVFLDECVSQTYTCTQVPSQTCQCRFNDDPPTLIDFSPIAKKGSPYFPFDTYGPTSDFEYAFNPCYGFSSGGCQGVTACQKYTPGDTTFDIGDPSPIAWNTPYDDTIEVTYSSTKFSETRKSIVSYICDSTALQPTLSFKNEVPTQVYNFDLKTCVACRIPVPGCPTSGGGGGGGGGITIGGVLCIVFTVLVLVYIVGGILFQKFARGATGKELIPNYNFWTDFPGLIKDGFLFMIAPCTGKRSSYETMK